jgi:hypothetical protein
LLHGIHKDLGFGEGTVTKSGQLQAIMAEWELAKRIDPFSIHFSQE